MVCVISVLSLTPLPQFYSQIFGNHAKRFNYIWCHRYLHVPQHFQLSGKVLVFVDFFAFLYFYSVVRWDGKILLEDSCNHGWFVSWVLLDILVIHHSCIVLHFYLFTFAYFEVLFLKWTKSNENEKNKNKKNKTKKQNKNKNKQKTKPSKYLSEFV